MSDGSYWYLPTTATVYSRVTAEATTSTSPRATTAAASFAPVPAFRRRPRFLTAVASVRRAFQSDQRRHGRADEALACPMARLHKPVHRRPQSSSSFLLQTYLPRASAIKKTESLPSPPCIARCGR